MARSAEQMSGILETLMAAARAEGQPDAGRSEVGGVLDARRGGLGAGGGRAPRSRSRSASRPAPR